MRIGKKILYIGGFELPDRNAAAQRVVANAKVFRELGYQVEFIGISKDRKNSFDEEHLVDGFVYHNVNYPSNIFSWFRYITHFVDRRAILSCAPNVIILYNFPSIPSFCLLNLGKKYRIKLFADITEWYVEKGLSPMKMVKRFDIAMRMKVINYHLDGIIVISQYLYDYYKSYCRTILVPPLVDLSQDKWSRNRNLKVNNPITLVYAGSPGNGLKDKLDIIVNSVLNYPEIYLKIIGINKSQYISVFGLLPDNCKNIKFLGKVSHEKAICEVCSSDFQIIIREINLVTTAGFPTKYVESMSCCIPVISNASSNICDYLENGKNGFIVSEHQSLDTVLQIVRRLNTDELIALKLACKQNNSFDYHTFLNDFQAFLGE